VGNQQNCRDARRDGAESKPDRKWQKAHRPNETELSHRWRDRAWQTSRTVS
jgi:hypothetical protein